MSIEVITGEIERALSHQFYYLALIGALTLPELCAALETTDGNTSGKNAALYTKWCDAWLTAYPDVAGSDIYALRCGVVHEGRLGNGKSKYKRIAFTLPDGRGNVIQQLTVNATELLSLDLVTFCRQMIASASMWYVAKQTDSNVQRNLPRLLQYRPQGLSPYIVGLPLIA